MEKIKKIVKLRKTKRGETLILVPNKVLEVAGLQAGDHVKAEYVPKRNQITIRIKGVRL